MMKRFCVPYQLIIHRLRYSDGTWIFTDKKGKPKIDWIGIPRYVIGLSVDINGSVFAMLEPHETSNLLNFPYPCYPKII